MSEFLGLLVRTFLFGGSVLVSQAFEALELEHEQHLEDFSGHGKSLVLPSCSFSRRGYTLYVLGTSGQLLEPRHNFSFYFVVYLNLI